MRSVSFTPFHEGERLGRPQTADGMFFDAKDERVIPDQSLGLFASHHRRRALFFLIVLVLSVFLMRIGYLQVASGAYYAGVAERNRVRTSVTRASRGLIYDQSGRVIVENSPEFILTVVPERLPEDRDDLRTLTRRLGDILHESPLAITESIATLPKHPLERRQTQLFRRRLDEQTAFRLMVEEETLSGLTVDVREQRSYPAEYQNEQGGQPMPESIAHITGYLGGIPPEKMRELLDAAYTRNDLIGKSGIEQTYDRALHGTHGRTYREVNAFGRQTSIIGEEPPIAGQPLVLTIDLDLQSILENKLREGIDALPERTRRGAVGVAIDPRNGAVRAMVSLPTYNPALFSSSVGSEAIAPIFTDPDQPLFHRAISGTYPSGSTIKPLIALAALEEGVIDEWTSILSTGGLAVGGSFFPDWLAGGHGSTNVRRAIAQSVNTFFYVIGGGYNGSRGLGPYGIARWLTKLSYGKTLGIDLPGEVPGLVPTPEWKEAVKNEPWYLGNTYHLSIGQGDILVTPLQMAAMTAAIANGGTLWQPHVVAQDEPIALVQSIASSYNVNIVRSGMRQAVTGGSAARLSLLPFTAAGKTGTAQWSATQPPHAWFTSFAPYENPELVLVIMIEEGEGGSTSAAPVAYEVLREYFARLST